MSKDLREQINLFRNFSNEGIEVKKLVNEQSVGRYLAKIFKTGGDDAVRTLVKNYSDDAVRNFEIAIQKAFNTKGNWVAKEGENFLLSASGVEIPFSTIETLIKGLNSGVYDVNKVASYLPRNLADGSEFRKIFIDNFSNKLTQGVEKSGSKALSMSSLGGSIESRYTFDLLSVNYKNLLNDLIRKTNKLNNFKFNPKDLKIVASENISGREVLEIKLPTGDNILWYRSSGSNVGPTGKETGEWFAIAGFSENIVGNLPKGWFIKDNLSIQLSKGGNQYITDMSNWFKSNWGK